MQDRITIDGAEYVRADSIDAGPTEVQIVVIEGRWNIVGRVARDDAGNLTITGGKVLTYWGTTKGLGEIAGGPTAKTKADPVPTCRVPASKVLLTLDADAQGWGL